MIPCPFRPRLLLLLLLPLGSAACVGFAGPTPAPTPARIDEVERIHAADPEDREAVLLLASGRLAQGDTARARSLLDGWPGSGSDPVLGLLEGLVAEAAGAPGRAMSLMEGYLAAEPHGAYQPEAAGRTDRLRRAARVATVREMLAREEELAIRMPRETRVAVLPFTWEEGVSSLPPLALVLTEMIAQDVSETQRLQVVEPSLVEALLVAMGVERARWRDTDVAERVGRILGAGALIQAHLELSEDGLLEVRGQTVTLGLDGVLGTGGVQERIDPALLPALEVRLFHLTYLATGEELSTVEARRIGREHPSLPEPWRALGRGLVAESSGDLEEAERAYRRAHELAGRFPVAMARAERVERLRAGFESPGDAAWRIAQIEVQKGRVAFHRSMAGVVAPALPGEGGPDGRAVLAELFGQDRVGVGTFLELLIDVGGGAP